MCSRRDKSVDVTRMGMDHVNAAEFADLLTSFADEATWYAVNATRVIADLRAFVAALKGAANHWAEVERMGGDILPGDDQ